MILLIGCGQMAIDHALVLKNLAVPFIVIGRSKENAIIFEKKIGIKPIIGGIESVISSGQLLPSIDTAIIATGIEGLHKVACHLIDLKYKKILIEKPAGINVTEILDLSEKANSANTKIFVAYNRRFYSSVLHAKKMISLEGGVTSFLFEFTEWGHEIAALKKAPGVKERWVLGNSSHVIDLAFFLGGDPIEFNALSDGHLDWHNGVSRFVGSGKTSHGALFSYHANWDSPGRWGLEVCTRNYRFFFRPLEKLQVLKRGSIESRFVEPENYQLDCAFKPGLYLQNKLFLENKEEGLCSIQQHAKNTLLYQKMAAYPD